MYLEVSMMVFQEIWSRWQYSIRNRPGISKRKLVCPLPRKLMLFAYSKWSISFEYSAKAQLKPGVLLHSKCCHNHCYRHCTQYRPSSVFHTKTMNSPFLLSSNAPVLVSNDAPSLSKSSTRSRSYIAQIFFQSQLISSDAPAFATRAACLLKWQEFLHCFSQLSQFFSNQHSCNDQIFFDAARVTIFWATPRRWWRSSPSLPISSALFLFSVIPDLLHFLSPTLFRSSDPFLRCPRSSSTLLQWPDRPLCGPLLHSLKMVSSP